MDMDIHQAGGDHQACGVDDLIIRNLIWSHVCALCATLAQREDPCDPIFV